MARVWKRSRIKSPPSSKKSLGYKQPPIRGKSAIIQRKKRYTTSKSIQATFVTTVEVRPSLYGFDLGMFDYQLRLCIWNVDIQTSGTSTPFLDIVFLLIKVPSLSRKISRIIIWNERSRLSNYRVLSKAPFQSEIHKQHPSS